MAYVDEELVRERELARGAQATIGFGPPSGGTVEVKVQGVKDWIVQFPDGSFRPEWVHVELLDGQGRAVARGEGGLSYTVPPHGPVADPGPDWTVRITNNGNRAETLQTRVAFTGYRPLLAKDVPFRLLNEKLDLIFTDPPPVKVVLENKIVEWRRQTQHGWEVRTEPPPAGEQGWTTRANTFATFRVSNDVKLVYGQIDDIDLGRRILERGTLETQDISVRATIHDGQFALKARVKFVSNGAVYAVSWAPNIELKSGAVEVYLVLAPTADGRPRFRPMVNAQVAGSMAIVDDAYVRYAIRGAVEYMIEERLGKMRGLDRVAQLCMTWILGDRNRRLINRRYELQIRYAGDEVGSGVVVDDEPALPPLQPGRLAAIKNIVVMMMENRSFDHLLGHLALDGRSDVDGLRLDMSNPVSLAGGGARKTVFRLGTTVGIHDPGHDFHSTKRQRGGYTIDLPAPLHDLALPPNAGFIIDYAGRLQRAGVPADEIAKHVADVMGFYGASDLPAYSQLAEDFTICDHWFASHPGHTWPNRFVSLTGRLAPGPDGRPQIDNPDMTMFDPLDVKSIFDHLDAAHVDWRYFEHDICFLRLFERYTEDRRIARIDDPERGFFALARAGALPPVTYVEPNITDLPPGNDDHPPSDIRRGQQLVAAVYNALRNGPQWKDTLFVITYDEHGGFFDHIHPADGACAALCHDPETGEPVTHYGMRVPTFVISPHVRKRFVAKDVYDHTTILKTIIQTFLHARPPSMGPRVAAARSLESLIDAPILDRRPIATEHLPPPAPEPGLVLAREPNDFHALMTRLALRRKPASTVIHDHR